MSGIHGSCIKSGLCLCRTSVPLRITRVQFLLNNKGVARESGPLQVVFILLLNILPFPLLRMRRQMKEFSKPYFSLMSLLSKHSISV